MSCRQSMVFDGLAAGRGQGSEPTRGTRIGASACQSNRGFCDLFFFSVCLLAPVSICCLTRALGVSQNGLLPWPSLCNITLSTSHKTLMNAMNLTGLLVLSRCHAHVVAKSSYPFASNLSHDQLVVI